MSSRIVQFGASRAQTAGYQLLTYGGAVIQRIDGFCTGSNSFLQIHDKASAPAANAVPLKSLQVFGNDGFSYVLPDVPLLNGAYLALSTDEEKYTADSSGTVVSGDVTIEDVSCLVGATRSAIDLGDVSGIADIWDGSAGPKTLLRIKVTNNEAPATKSWLALFAASAADANVVPLMFLPLFEMSTGAAVNTSPTFDFNFSPFGKDGSVNCTGLVALVTTLTNPATRTVAALFAGDYSTTAGTILTCYYK